MRASYLLIIATVFAVPVLFAPAAAAESASAVTNAARGKAAGDKTAGDKAASDAAVKKSAKKKPKRKKAAEPDVDSDVPAVTTAKGVSVMTLAQSAQLGLQYRIDLGWTDNGFEKSGDNAVEGTADVSLAALKLSLKGELRSRVAYELLVDYSIPGVAVEVGRAVWWPAKSFGIAAGINYFAQGGFENKRFDYRTIALSPYTSHYLPLAGSPPMFELQWKAAGLLTLQIAADQPIAKTAGVEERVTQPAVGLEWLGSFGVVAPLLQLGSYDKGRSKFVDVGLGLELKQLAVYADYIMDRRSGTYTKVDGSGSTKLDTTLSVIGLEASYTLTGSGQAFAKVSSFSVAQPDDVSVGSADRGFNSQTEGLSQDDNTDLLALGWRHFVAGQAFVPYVAFVMQSAKFEHPTEADTLQGRSQLAAHVGIHGEM